MAASKIGAFALQHRYRIADGTHEEYMSLMAIVYAWLMEMGVASFEIWRDADDPRTYTEVQGYDSWSHYMRVNKVTTPPKIKEVYHDLELLLDGGFAQVATQTWEAQAIPKWDGTT